MKAALLFDSPGKWEVCEVELDEPHDHEVLVRMVASGLCHSDAHYMTGDGTPPPLPFCGGHEGAGVIEAVGPGVVDLAAGDHVVLSFIPVCGRCRMCSQGRQNLCDLGRFLLNGPQMDGTFRMHHKGRDVHEYLMIGTFSPWTVVSEYNCVKVDNDLPLETLCLLGCGVGTGWGSAVNGAQVRPGDTVIVMGVGGIGINAVQGARHAGATTLIAVDPVALKRETALALGATHAVTTIGEATDYARSVTNGNGADSALVTVDVVTGQHVAEAFAAIGKAGTVVVTGIAATKDQMGIPVSLLDLVKYQKRIQGLLFGGSSPTLDIPRQVAMYRAGQLKLDELITQTYQLQQINDAYEDLFAGRNVRGVIIHEH